MAPPKDKPNKDEKKPNLGPQAGGSGDGGIKILKNPDLPCADQNPIRRLELPNKTKVLLISTINSTFSAPWFWANHFPLPCNSYTGSHNSRMPFNSKMPQEPILRFDENPLKCGGDLQKKCGADLMEQCNFAVVINTGASADPYKFQGLAHFLEHIVHHGSEKYPGDDSLNLFFYNNHGFANAFTDRVTTRYFAEFKYNPQALRLGLEMYADLLIKPELDLKTIQNEVISIENELHLRRTFNFFRVYQLVNSLAIPGDHPLKKFMCGSLQTLLPTNRKPEELKNEILKFHQAHYRPDNMSLVIQAPASLDILQAYVLETFGSIKQALPTVPNSEKHEGNIGIPYTMKEFNKLITIKPGNRDFHTLELLWAFPADAWRDYKGKPLHYIAELLKNEKPGGLKKFLLSRSWIMELLVGAGEPGGGGTLCNKYVTLLSMEIFLTQGGRDEIDEVLEAVFCYIRLLQKQGPQKQLFDEFKLKTELMFQSLPLGNTSDVSTALGKSIMSNYDEEHLVTGNTLYFEYKPIVIKSYLDELTPERACYVLLTADSEYSRCLQDVWYGANYKVQELTPGMLQRFQVNNSYASEFRLEPTPNPFLDEKLYEKQQTDDNESYPEQKVYIPSCHIKVLHNPIYPIHTYQSSYFVQIISTMHPRICRSKQPVFDVLSVMLQRKAEKQLTFVQLKETGVDINVCFAPEQACLIIKTTGLNTIAKPALENLVDLFITSSWNNKEDEELFDMAKQFCLHLYYEKVTTPFIYAQDLCQRMKSQDHLLTVECHEMLKQIKWAEMKRIILTYRSKIGFIGLVTGAAPVKDVLELCQNLNNFKITTMTDFEIEGRQHATGSPMKILPDGERCLRIKSLLPNENPFVILNYYQMDHPSKESIKITKILVNMIRDTVMYELRTKEQLGYVVSALMYSDLKNGIGIMVMANSDRHSPCYIDGRIEKCIEKIVKEKLTVQTLKPLLQASNIMRDPSYVQELARKYLINNKGSVNPGTGYSKLTVQVCHHNVHKKCNGQCCRESKWLKPLFHVGKEDAQICVAGPRKLNLCNKSVYFVESTEAFHKFDQK